MKSWLDRAPKRQNDPGGRPYRRAQGSRNGGGHRMIAVLALLTLALLPLSAEAAPGHKEAGQGRPQGRSLEQRIDALEALVSSQASDVQSLQNTVAGQNTTISSLQQRAGDIEAALN